MVSLPDWKLEKTIETSMRRFTKIEAHDGEVVEQRQKALAEAASDTSDNDDGAPAHGLGGVLGAGFAGGAAGLAGTAGAAPARGVNPLAGGIRGRPSGIASPLPKKA